MKQRKLKQMISYLHLQFFIDYIVYETSLQTARRFTDWLSSFTLDTALSYLPEVRPLRNKVQL